MVNLEERFPGLDLSQSMLHVLGIAVDTLTKEKVEMTMPVNQNTKQPFGVLHGGASVALAETAASFGTACYIDLESEIASGMAINANHVKPKQNGVVRAIAMPYHKGKTSMVWEIKIVDEAYELISIARCTVAIRMKSR